MDRYKFVTDQFGITDTGIYLLRSGFNYETIEFDKIDKLYINKGRQISNWVIALLFGVLLVSLGLYVLHHAFYEYFIGTRVRVFYVEQFVFPIIPLIIGIYSVFVSLKNGLVLNVNISGKIKKLPVDKLIKNGQIDELIIFLNHNSLLKEKFKSYL